MKLTAKTTDLRRAISTVGRAAASRTTIPILSHALLECRADGLHVTATDLELAISARADADIKEPGEAATPCKELSALLAAMPGDTVTLEGDDKHALTITAGKSRYQMHGLPASEYPMLPQHADRQIITFPADELLHLIRHTENAISNDSGRHILTGALLEYKPDGLVMAATDTHRLALAIIECVVPQPLFPYCIIPARGLQEIARMLDASGGDAVLQVSATLLEAGQGDVRVLTRLIEGQFPGYERVVPDRGAATVTVTADAAALRDAVKRCRIISQGESNKVLVTISHGEALLLESRTSEGEAREEVEQTVLLMEHDDEPFVTAFNADYLLDGLEHCTGEVELLFSQPLSPMLLTCSDLQGWLYVAMPMQML